MKKKKDRLPGIMAAIAAASMLASAVMASSATCITKTVTVAPGDTLWSLWEEHGHGRADKWIAEVRDMNDMDSAAIYPLDVLRVPVIAE